MKQIGTLAFGITLLSFSGSAWAQSKLTKEVNGLDAQSQVRVIVKWKRQPTAEQDQKVTGRGGLQGSHLQSIRAGSYQLSAAAAADLAKDPEVDHISIDHPLHSKLDNTAAAINASAAWAAGINGNGVGVAVIDSGITPAKDLGFQTGFGSRIVFTQDFVNPLNSGEKIKNYGQDQYGHGEHIAGIIGGNGFSSYCTSCTRTFIGTAPGANLINLRVLDQNGSGSDSTVIAAIDQAIALKNLYNIRVINLSLGHPVYESYQDDPLCQAVEAAWQAGIVVVVAAGNDGRDDSFGNFGYGTINSPGNDPYVITVGAMRSMGTPTRTDDLIASYSSKGPTQVDHIVKPDILAPGNLVVSLNVKGGTLENESPNNAVSVSYYQGNKNGNQTSQSYFTLSGTSMATGVVSGAVADLIHANPRLTPDQVKLLLMQTAYKTFPATSSVYDPASNQTYTSYYDLFTVGAGYLDLGAAFAMVNSVPAGISANSPVAAYDPTTGNVTMVMNPSVDPSRTLWGAGGVWSASVLNSLQVVWDQRTVWGAASTVDDSRTIWGARTLWGASAVASDRTLWGATSVDGSRTLWGAASPQVQDPQ